MKIIHKFQFFGLPSVITIMRTHDSVDNLSKIHYYVRKTSEEVTSVSIVLFHD